MHGIPAALAIFFVTFVGFLILRAAERHIAPSKATLDERLTISPGPEGDVP
jgi:hypothetical protein